MPEVRLVLLGERETGKSSAGNSILGRRGLFRAGAVTEECVRRQEEVAARLVTVVDTPGWEAGVAGRTTDRVKREIAASEGLCPPGPHALLLTLRVDTLVESGHVRDHVQLLSEGAWRHTLLLFTHGDQLREGVDIREHIRGGGRGLQWLLDKCGGRYHVIGSPDGGQQGEGSTAELLQKVEKMAAMNRCEAFSSLVHEIRDLSQQRNEKFNQRLKDMGDKMLRQEAELNKMREREMRRIRWFFERKKKAKSREKKEEEEEDDEDGRMGERKADYRELEERIRWLTEDKEREIQDLSVERERLHVWLRKSTKERDDATFRLDLKEREMEELKERMEEQQLKGAEQERERRHREESVEAMKRAWTGEVGKLVEDLELLTKDKEEWVEKVLSLKKELRDSREQQERAQEAMARMMAEVEAKLLEKDRQQEELQRKMQASLDAAELRQRQLRAEAEQMKSRHEKELERRTRDAEADVRRLELRHREEMDGKMEEVRTLREEARAERQRGMEAVAREKTEACREREREVEELKRALEEEAERRVREKMGEMRELERRCLAQMEKRALESKDEIEAIRINFRKEVEGKEQEIERMKQQHQEDMERAKEQRVKETERAVEEVRKEYRERMRDLEEEGRRGMEELRQRFEREAEKQRRERQRVEKHALELEERVRGSEDAKEAMMEDHRRSIRLHLTERDALLDALKREHDKETRERVEALEEEKEGMAATLREEAEKMWQGKERELEELRVSLEDVKERLRRTEDEKRDTEERRRRETELMKERAADLEERARRAEEERAAGEGRARRERREKDEAIEALHRRVEDASELLRRQEEEVEQRLRDREGEVEGRMQRLLKERDGEMERVRRQAEAREVAWRDDQRRMEKRMKAATELIGQQAREVTEARRLLVEREAEAAEKGEIQRLKKEEGEKEKEVALLRSRMEQTRAELKDVTRKMEEGMASMIREYEREIQRKDQTVEAIVKEKELVAEELGRRTGGLREENEKMRKEAEGLRLRLKEAEEEVKRCVQGREADRKEREAKIERLKETRDALRAEMDSIKAKHGQAIQEIKADFQAKLGEKEQRIKGEIWKREEEVAERERVSARKEEALRKRGSELDRKQEELAEIGLVLENKARQLSETQACLGRRDERREDERREELWEWEREEPTAERRSGRRDDRGSATAGQPGGNGGHVDTVEEEELQGKGKCQEKEHQENHPAEGGNDRHAGTLRVIKEGKEGVDAERKTPDDPSTAKVTRDYQFLSGGRGSNNDRGSQGSELRVMVLGESWSTHSPGGVTILCGETSKEDGSALRHWRGQVAGRRLSVVEPLGLRWRDGPSPDDTSPRESVLEGAWWLRPGPDVVLILLPAFLTCTRRLRSAAEEHAGWLGADVWRRALLLLTWGEVMGESAEQHVLRNGELTGLVEKCQGKYHVVTSSREDSLVEGLLEKMEDIVASNGR